VARKYLVDETRTVAILDPQPLDQDGGRAAVNCRGACSCSLNSTAVAGLRSTGHPIINPRKRNRIGWRQSCR
jgi:hypothetical protein